MLCPGKMSPSTLVLAALAFAWLNLVDAQCCAYGGDGAITASVRMALGNDFTQQLTGVVAIDPSNNAIAEFFGSTDPTTAVMGMRVISNSSGE